MKKYALIAFAMVLACAEPERSLVNQNADFVVKSGRLVFNNAAAITKVINSITSKSDAELDSWEDGIQGFTSLRSASVNPVNSDNAEVQLPRALQSILNQDGAYQIGTEIVVFKGNHEIIFPQERENDILKVVTGGAQAIHNYRIKEFKPVILQTVPSKGSANADQNLDARFQWEWEAGPSDTYKSVFESYAYAAYGYIVLGMRIKYEHKQKNWYGWTDWAQSFTPTRKYYRSLRFEGAITSYYGSYWEHVFADVPSNNVTGETLVAEAAVAAQCIGPFDIKGIATQARLSPAGYILNIASSDGPPNFGGYTMWGDIYFCAPGGGGGGSGGGSGGGGDPPPSCSNGCVWGGSECVCP